MTWNVGRSGTLLCLLNHQYAPICIIYKNFYSVLDLRLLSNSLNQENNRNCAHHAFLAYI